MYQLNSVYTRLLKLFPNKNAIEIYVVMNEEPIMITNNILINNIGIYSYKDTKKPINRLIKNTYSILYITTYYQTILWSKSVINFNEMMTLIESPGIPSNRYAYLLVPNQVTIPLESGYSIDQRIFKKQCRENNQIVICSFIIVKCVEARMITKITKTYCIAAVTSTYSIFGFSGEGGISKSRHPKTVLPGIPMNQVRVEQGFGPF